MYNEPTNMTGILGIFKYANEVSDGIFGVGIAITLYLVILGYLHLKGENFADCAVVAGYITSITSIMLFIMGLISSLHLFAVFMMCVIPALWSYFQKT